MVALAGRGHSDSCRAGTGDCDCITAGVSVIPSHHSNSANADAGPTTADTNTGPANAANATADTTYAGTANAGTCTNHGSSAGPGYADTDTTYSAGSTVSGGADYVYFADDVSDAGTITGLDSYATTLAPDADATTGFRS